MLFTDSARKLLEKLEGLKLKAYLDEAGVWTIGYGHTGHDVEPGLVWTPAQADLALARDIQQFANGVHHLITPGVVLSDNQFSALTIFAFNIGLAEFAASTALRRVNIRAFFDVPPAMSLFKWVHDRHTGKLFISDVLVRRRAAEVRLWSTQ